MFVGKIPWTVTAEDLGRHFEQYGRCEVKWPARQNGELCYAYVTFDTVHTASAAVHTPQIIRGAPIKVEFAEPPKNQGDYGEPRRADPNTYGLAGQTGFRSAATIPGAKGAPAALNDRIFVGRIPEEGTRAVLVTR